MKTKLLVILIAALFLLPAFVQAAEKEILVTKIKITGNTVIKSESLSKAVKNFEGRYITLSELQKVAGLITEEYSRRGYIIAKAYIPEQKIINGVVEIAVLEGKIGEVKVQGKHEYYSTEFIKKHFDPIVEEKALNQDALERALLILNEYPKLTVTSMLQAGQEPGTTDIIVTANNSIPIHLTLDYNNFGSRYVSGVSRFGATFDAANLLTEGSIFSIRGITGLRPDESLFGRISYSIPLNNIGTRLGIYYNRGGFDVGREFAILNITGRTEAAGVFVTHPYIKKRNTSLIAEIGFDLKNTRQVMMDQVTSRDRTRALRAGVSYESVDLTGRTSASLSITQGLGHTLDAMSNDDPLSSRLSGGADNAFTKANLDLLRLQKIIPPVFLMLKASGQWAAQSLVAGEQFAIGGADSVRGYPLSEYSGDDGYSATAELRVSPFENKEIFQLAFFIDNGGISVKVPAIGQHKSRNLTGGGGGIRLNLPQDFNIRADIGIPLGISASDNRNAAIYLQAVKRF